MKPFKLCVAAFLFFSFANQLVAQQARFFGYWANNGSTAENYDHSNITHVWAGIKDQNTAVSLILGELAQVQSNGLRAIVSVDTFVFNMSGDATSPTGRAECPYTFQSSAGTRFAQLVNALISNGYLVPNNPGASTVAAFMPVDEPEDCGLNDQGGSPHSALAHAVNTIKNNPNTTNFPQFVNVAGGYGSAIQGVRLFDWAGLDRYNNSTGTYLSNFSSFSNQLHSWQRTVLVPQASFGGFMSSYGPWHDPDLIFNKFMSDSKVIGIMPFLWDHVQTTGTRDIPLLRHAYENYGAQIRSGNLISASVFCIPWSQHQHRCFASASGGSAPYSYSWSAPCGGTGSIVFCDCTAPPGQSVHVNVTATDSVGLWRKAVASMTCGSDPQWNPDADG